MWIPRSSSALLLASLKPLCCFRPQESAMSLRVALKSNTLQRGLRNAKRQERESYGS